MSYILDALKKSEAEQDPTAAVNLALNQQRNQSRQRLTGILVGAALLANVAVLLWLFGPTGLDSPALRVVAPPAEPAPATTSAVVRQPLPDPVFEPPSVQPARLISARLPDLPTAVRSRFPGLAFSTHIYAEDSSLRAVVANGNRLVEGDEIGGATVQRITEDGVVLAFENYLVEIPVVAEWE